MEELIAVGIDVYLVVLERQCPVLTGEQLDQFLVLLRQHQILLFGKLQHRTLRELVQTVLRDHLLLPCVLSEEEIEYDTHQRKEYQHQHPRHGLGWLTVIHQHRNHRTDNCQYIDSEE